VKKQTRRKFLRAASLSAAAIGLPLSRRGAVAAAEAQVFLSEPFQLLTGEKIKTALLKLDAKPGNDNVFGTKILPFTMALTVEKNKVDTQFEYHEDRDHLFQILEGSTTYEVGGTPQGGHSEQPGQWHSPTSAGASTITLNKGDMLLIPRGMPHKRITEKSVTFMLISATSSLKA
jgi:mannose-6-phosphate isomerase-like protein (cupin superfamily)